LGLNQAARLVRQVGGAVSDTEFDSVN
jgi:hypothetical protein